VEALELAADLLELAEEVVDLRGHRVDLVFEIELLLRLAPLGTRLRRDELLPLRVDHHDVLHDALDQRQRAIRFGECEELPAHANTIPCTSSGCGMKPTTFLSPSSTTIVART